tara:strand:+ start:1505 stop:2098 length:594 start_codon:yes stop_codon:yes gene_type:complete
MNLLKIRISNGFLLDSDRLLDSPVPVSKGFFQIIKENTFLLTSIAFIFILTLLIIFYLRKRKKTGIDDKEEKLIDPYEEALSAITALKEEQSILSPKPFIFRLSEILRIYVEKVFNVPAMELTGEEFMREIASHSFFKNRYDEILREFIRQGDRIKYSEENFEDGEMNLLMQTALHFVQDTHEKLQDSLNREETPAS